MNSVINIISKSRLWLHLHNLFDFVVFLGVGLHGWLLVFRIPHTLKVLFEAFRPGGHGIKNADFWAFGPTDAGFRPWYNKIARDFHVQGRFGYAWDNGLGMPLGPRIYNNWLSYKVLYWFGTRWMMAIGYLLLLMSSAGLSYWCFGPETGLIVGLLMAGSPLLVVSCTHLGKPEVFWWGPAILFVFSAFSGMGLYAGLFWSLLAFANLPVSTMLAMLLAPALFFSSLSSDSLVGLFIGVIPGAVKHMLRIIYMWRSGSLTKLVSEQSRLWKRPWHPIPFELAWWFPFVLSIVLSGYTSQQFITCGLILVFGLGLHWANYRIIYLNDEQAFHLAFLTIGLGYAVAVQSLVGLLGIILFAYSHPPFWYESIWWKCPHDRHKAWQIIKSYSQVKPIRLPHPPQCMTFFNQIPDGARILLESDGDPRTESIFRAFTQWTEEFLPQRQVDLANEIFTRSVEPTLVTNYLNHFNGSKMNPQTMGQLCKVLGVSHVMVFSSATARALESIGYKQIAHVDLKTLETHDLSMLRLPRMVLALLRAPVPVTVIEPATRWSRQGNILTWHARAGQSYIIRYRNHQNFRAYQNGQTLKVEPVRPVKELPLTFMRVTAIADGQVILWFADFFARIFGAEKRRITAFMKPDESKGATLNRQGEEKYSNGDIDGALHAFTKAIGVDPEFATPHNNLGVLYWQTGDLKQAVDHFARAVEIDPNDRDTIVNCGEVFQSLGKIADARTIYSSWLKKNPGDQEIARSLAQLEDTG